MSGLIRVIFQTTDASVFPPRIAQKEWCVSVIPAIGSRVFVDDGRAPTMDGHVTKVHHVYRQFDAPQVFVVLE